MTELPGDPPARALDELAVPASATNSTRPAAPAGRGGEFVDWRTIDPATIQGPGIPVEELRFYREKIDELLQAGEGQYVLIVGREVAGFFPDIEAAARRAEESFRGERFLIKKVAAVAPVQHLGGVVG